ncbi:hypothetical protein [Cyclobacterium sp.]|uniref:hypothetical protein n=1 Tax=Cyclobacterium sp. TaxID=1966343 RepID=UPI0019BE3324|nr:hypothetical protein [Cyclobacterium sp.]MBD3627623.1 hypothetical protein [Cyclobacterium sp.]
MNPIKEKTTELLDLFRVKHPTSAYEQRLSHYIPLEWGQTRWTGAANSHSFILVPECKENKVPEPEAKVVNLQGILPKAVLYQAEIEKRELIDMLNEIPLIKTNETAECPSCEGAGRFEHWGDTYDCQHCQETGEIRTNRTIEVRDPEYVFTLDGKMITSDNIDKLIQAIAVSEAEKIYYMVTTGNDALLLFSLDYQIIVGLALYRPLNAELKIADIAARCISMQDLETIEVMRA